MTTPDAPTAGTAPEHLSTVTARLDHEIFDLVALLKAGEALHDELDVKRLMRLLIAMIHERLRVDEIAVMLHDSDTGFVVVEVVDGLPEELLGSAFPAKDGILWRMILSGERISVVDINGEPRFPNIFREHGLRALQGQTWLPLVMPDQVVGLVSVGAPRPGETITASRWKFIEQLAGQAAVAINTARLYQSIAIARKKLDRSLHQLSMLFDVTRALSAVTDLTRMLKMILERAIDAVDAEKGSLMLVDELTDDLVVLVVYGLPDKEVERKINEGEIECKRLARGEGVAGTVLMSGKAIRVDNTDDDGKFADRSQSRHVHSILCVPLKVDDEVIGVINITNKVKGGVFQDEDEEILGALSDQAAVAITRAKLFEAAITDGLTGLYIRRFVMHKLHEEVKRAQRYGNQLSIVMCDIDFFKRVNDNWGHPAGDAVLMDVAAILKSSVRTDVDYAGRYGGEEFLIIMPQTGGSGGVLASDRLRASIEALTVDIGDDKCLTVTMSFGVAELSLDTGDTVEALIKRADVALYQSKENGRNRVTLHDGLTGDASVADVPVADVPVADVPASEEHGSADFV
ncbi:MAG: sensor domain-containing diguanylate cyclase [Oligoflexia bacterium]|nr:sensor domain-containing diguanylate cyclase [Oligoflexia bacterium]